MEMHQIKYFLAVCETLNFTRAAERCNDSQPALSRAIQSLEQEVGGLLFRRERNLTHLTDLGQLLRPYLEQARLQSEAAKHAARGFLTLATAELNLGVMCTVGPMRFISFLARFRAENPNVELSMVEGVPSRLSELLESGQLDIAIMAQPGPFPDRFRVEPIYRERFVVALPSNHRLTRLNAIPIQELSGEPYLSRINCEYRDYLSELSASHGVKVNRIYRSEREDWIQVMVAAGLGLCLVPEFSPTIAGVQTRPMVEPEVSREVSLVSVAGRRYSPVVSHFIKALRAYRWPEQENELAAAS